MRVRFWLSSSVLCAALLLFSCEMKKREAAKAQEAGVKTLLHSYAVAAIPGKDGLAGVMVESKSGRQAILAKVIVDATGDGDVAARAGAAYEKGRPEDGLMQPMSLEYKVHNLDRKKARSFLAQHRSRVIGAARAEGEAIPSFIGAWTHKNFREDETYLNPDHAFGVDGTSVEDLSRAAMDARKQIWQSITFSRKYIPGYEHAYLSATASQMGVRETRRIAGEYVLTVEDVLGGRKFDDAVAQYACWIDIHRLDPNKDRGPYTGKALKPGTSYDIPYRCLIPAGVENLLVAGRCFSATHEAMASARMIPCCMAMGQAAGTAAALAAKQNIRPRELDVGHLQDVLRQENVRI